MKPLGNRVIVKLDEAQEKKGSLYLPDVAKDRPQEGMVVSAGPGLPDNKGKIKALEVKAGDRVLISKHSGTEVITPDGKIYILSEDNILGVLT